MKKRILSLVLLVVVIFLSSCTDTDVLESQGGKKHIQFKVSSSKIINGLKATQIQGVNLADISGELGVKCVTKAGINIDFEEPLYYDAASNRWNTQEYKYADTISGFYDFYALYPKELFNAPSMTVESRELKFDYTVTPNADVDVLGAASIGIIGADSRANFQLKHLLTQVNYGIILDTNIGYVRITSVKMKGFKPTATCKLGNANASWAALSGNAVDYDLLNIDTRVMNRADISIFNISLWDSWYTPADSKSIVFISDKEKYSKMLIPQSFSVSNPLTFEIIFDAYKADKTTVHAMSVSKTITIDNLNAEAGKLYTITLDFNTYFDGGKKSLEVGKLKDNSIVVKPI